MGAAGGARLHVEVLLPPDRSVSLRYTDPDGSTATAPEAPGSGGPSTGSVPEVPSTGTAVVPTGPGQPLPSVGGTVPGGTVPGAPGSDGGGLPTQVVPPLPTTVLPSPTVPSTSLPLPGLPGSAATTSTPAPTSAPLTACLGPIAIGTC